MSTWPLSRDRDTLENRELLEVFAPDELSAWREAHGALRRMVADRCDLVHRMRFRGAVVEPAWRAVMAALRQVRHAFGLPRLPTLDDRLASLTT